MAHVEVGRFKSLGRDALKFVLEESLHWVACDDNENGTAKYTTSMRT